MTKYVKISTISFSNRLEYRSDLFFSLFSKVFPFIIQVYMWKALYGGSADGVLLNYSYKDIMLYTIITLFVSALLAVDVHYKVAGEIKDGHLSRFLVQPLSHMQCKASEYIGEKAADFVFIALIMSIVLVALSAVGWLKLSFLAVLKFLGAMAVGISLQFLLFYCLSAAAFWIGECGGVFTAIGVISSIISGAVFPLDVFGPEMLIISRYLPFYYIVYFPSNVLIGRVSAVEFWQGLAVMAVWFAVLMASKHVIWKNGMKRYIAAGG